MKAELANQLAKEIQSQVPFVERPYLQVADKIGCDEKDVIEQLQSWSAEGKLREVSAILEGTALGYDSALCCGTVPTDRMNVVAKVLNQHPAVTHNYERNHDYNIWFTLGVPLEMGLEKTLELLAKEAGVECFYPLRKTYTFKIGITFDLETKRNVSASRVNQNIQPVALTERDKLMFRALQTKLPFCEKPFDALAKEFGFQTQDFLSFAGKHSGNAIRKYVGTFRHQKLGVRANGMIVWEVPEDEIQNVGTALAESPEVSHCYARNLVPGFPYTLYSMVHGPDQSSCLSVAEDLSQKVGVENYRVLFSTREFKKVRLRYFLPELDSWWRSRTSLGLSNLTDLPNER